MWQWWRTEEDVLVEEVEEEAVVEEQEQAEAPSRAAPNRGTPETPRRAARAVARAALLAAK